MKLKELLNITSLDTVVKIEGIKNRVKSDIITLRYKNEYNIIESWKYESELKDYEDRNILSQHIENDMLVILISLNN
ncbi:hypothetical protein P5F71_08570 [Clostridium perfringens]|nr:hypothetical protein [Clostridium perfringens]